VNAVGDYPATGLDIRSYVRAHDSDSMASPAALMTM
jgi:hypothetical protein